ncbi:hypothetical protein Pcinc_021917 [Petrolisthes cinctipes]|uniref:Uncharacterized protein n=1 Tax=Petrolisthes cinctipes TaxID=88211 RepID=A0AAE1FH40_PETCI|nr:hypothetical protein Pcinc_021917 [Petrolisthes cinctipes]
MVNSAVINVSDEVLVASDGAVVISEEPSRVSEVSAILSASAVERDESATASTMSSSVISDDDPLVTSEASSLAKQSTPTATSRLKESEETHDINTRDENDKVSFVIPDLEHAQHDVSREAEENIEHEDSRNDNGNAGDNKRGNVDNTLPVNSKQECNNKHTESQRSDNIVDGNRVEELRVDIENGVSMDDKNDVQEREINDTQDNDEEESSDDETEPSNDRVEENQVRVGENEEIQHDEENESIDNSESEGVEWAVRVGDIKVLKCHYLVLEVRSAVSLTKQHFDLARTHLCRCWWWWNLWVRPRGSKRVPWLCIQSPTPAGSTHNQQINNNDDYDDDDDDDDDDEDDDSDNDDDNADGEIKDSWWQRVELHEYLWRDRGDGNLCLLTPLSVSTPIEDTTPQPPKNNMCVGDAFNVDTKATAVCGASNSIIDNSNTAESTPSGSIPVTNSKVTTDALGNGKAVSTESIVDCTTKENPPVTNSGDNTGDSSTNDCDTSSNNVPRQKAATGDNHMVTGTSKQYRTSLLLAFPRFLSNTVSPQNVCCEVLGILDRVLEESKDQGKTAEGHGQTGEVQEQVQEGQAASGSQEQAEVSQEQNGGHAKDGEGRERAGMGQGETGSEPQVGMDQEAATGNIKQDVGEAATKHQEQVSGEDKIATGKQGQAEETDNGRRENTAKGKQITSVFNNPLGKEQLTWLQSLFVSDMKTDTTPQDKGSGRSNNNNNNSGGRNMDECSGYLEKKVDLVICKNFINKCKAARISYVSGFMTSVSLATASLLGVMGECERCSGEVVIRQRVWVQREWPDPPYAWHDHEERSRRRERFVTPLISLTVPKQSDSAASFWETARHVHKQYWEMPRYNRVKECIHFAQPNEDRMEQFSPPRYPIVDLTLAGAICNCTKNEEYPSHKSWSGKCVSLLATHKLTELKHFLLKQSLQLSVCEETQALQFTIKNHPHLPASIAQNFAEKIVAFLTLSLNSR